MVYGVLQTGVTEDAHGDLLLSHFREVGAEVSMSGENLARVICDITSFAVLPFVNIWNERVRPASL